MPDRHSQINYHSRLIGMLAILLILPAVLCFLPLHVEAATGMDSADVLPEYRDLSVYYYDYPGSLLGDALKDVFNRSDRVRLTSEFSVHTDLDNLLLLLSEHQAYPSLRHSVRREESDFQPLYRATLVIAVDKTRVGQTIDSWSTLGQYIIGQPQIPLGILLDPSYVISSFKMTARNQDEYARFLATLGTAHSHDNLRIFRGPETNTAWPLSLVLGNLEEDSLPPIMILWDYQVAQINLKLGWDCYEFMPPQEGSIFVDFGLYAQGTKACQLLNEKVNNFSKDFTQRKLLQYGYRLADGSSPYYRTSIFNPFGQEESLLRTFGYPSEEAYAGKQIRIKNYEEFNKEFLDNLADFRNFVLNENTFLPANSEQEHILMSIFLPLFLLWIGSIFFRLGSPSMKRSMGLLLFWLSVAVFLQFVQLMYTNYQTGDLLYYIRFLPYFGIFESWYFSGVSLARASGLISKKQQGLFFLLSLLFYTLAIAFVLNDLHGLSFTLSPYKRITSLGILSYLVIAGCFVLWLLGTLLLLKCQARVYKSMIFFPSLGFAILLGANYFFFSFDASLYSGLFDLLNILSWSFLLELSLQCRLIPANTGYIRLFNRSPVNLRFLSEDLQKIYPSEKDNISRNTMRLIKEAIIEHYATETKVLPTELSEKESQADHIKVQDYGNKGLIYNISKIYGGYLIWESNISEILKLKSEISELNSTLEKQARVLAQERVIRSQYLSMQIRQQMLHSIEDSLAEQMAVIRQSLAEIEASEDIKFVRKELSRVKIMVSQCKRKSNLLVRGEEYIQIEEVQMIFNEALQDAATSGLQALALCQSTGPVPTKILLFAYDYFQAILEQSVDLKKVSIFLNLNYANSCLELRLLFNASEDLDRAFFQAPLDKLKENTTLQHNLQIEKDAHDLRLTLELREEKS